MEANVIGIDLAKNIFQACAVDERGKELWNKRMSRSSFNKLLSTPTRATFAMEAVPGLATGLVWQIRTGTRPG